MRGVTIMYLVTRSTAGQLLLSELADRLQRRIAGAGGSALHRHQRLAHQRIEPIEHVELGGIGSRHRGCRSDVESSGEDGAATEQAPFGAIKQVERPAD